MPLEERASQCDTRLLLLPLEGLEKLDIRIMTLEQIGKLLEHCKMSLPLSLRAAHLEL